MKARLRVAFTEVVERSLEFVVELDDDVDPASLDVSEVHELLDHQEGWDQPSADDWRDGSIESREIDGVEVLVAPIPEGRFRARFVPQAWVRDNAIGVDPQGPTSWDCTEFVESADREWRERTVATGHDIDDLLRSDPNAPRWIRDWSGPFETYVEVIHGDDRQAAEAPATIARPEPA
jgi:hypothetical protein